MIKRWYARLYILILSSTIVITFTLINSALKLDNDTFIKVFPSESKLAQMYFLISCRTIALRCVFFL